MNKNKKNNMNDIDASASAENNIVPEKDTAEKSQESGKVDFQEGSDAKVEFSDQKKLEAELEKKVKEIETLTDTMKRRQADFENYKKRMIKTQEEQRKLAIKDFAVDIISINDDLLRAYDAACNISRDKTVDEICNMFSGGFSMISKSLEGTLKKFGIEEIDSLDKPFDPNFNEAVEIDESESAEHDTITKVYQKGFRFGDYVLRSARVRVTKAKKANVEIVPKDNKNGAGNTDPAVKNESGTI